VDRAAVRFDDCARDCETQTAAAPVARSSVIEAIKPLEYMLELILRYSWSRVADGNLKVTVSGPCRYGHAIAGLGVCHRIAHEVAQDLGEPVRIGYERSVRAFEPEIALSE
jgi:hypothetical protein